MGRASIRRRQNWPAHDKKVRPRANGFGRCRRTGLIVAVLVGLGVQLSQRIPRRCAPRVDFQRLVQAFTNLFRLLLGAMRKGQMLINGGVVRVF